MEAQWDRLLPRLWTWQQKTALICLLICMMMKLVSKTSCRRCENTFWQMITWLINCLCYQDVSFGMDDIEQVMDRPGQSLTTKLGTLKLLGNNFFMPFGFRVQNVHAQHVYFASLTALHQLCFCILQSCCHPKSNVFVFRLDEPRILCQRKSESSVGSKPDWDQQHSLFEKLWGCTKLQQSRQKCFILTKAKRRRWPWRRVGWLGRLWWGEFDAC